MIFIVWVPWLFRRNSMMFTMVNSIWADDIGRKEVFGDGSFFSRRNQVRRDVTENFDADKTNYIGLLFLVPPKGACIIF